jgi:hypothetical protein
MNLSELSTGFSRLRVESNGRPFEESNEPSCSMKGGRAICRPV